MNILLIEIICCFVSIACCDHRYEFLAAVSCKFDSLAFHLVQVLYLRVTNGKTFRSLMNEGNIFRKFLFSRLWFNGWQLAKMKKSIPDMSLPWNL